MTGTDGSVHVLGAGGPPVIVVVDWVGTVVAAGRGLDALVAADRPGTMLGRSIYELLPPEEQARLYRMLVAAAHEPDEAGVVTVMGRRHDGLPLVLRISAPVGSAQPPPDLPDGAEAPTTDDEPAADDPTQGRYTLIVERAGGPVAARADELARPVRVGADHVLSHDARGAIRNARNFVGLARRAVAAAVPLEPTEPTASTAPPADEPASGPDAEPEPVPAPALPAAPPALSPAALGHLDTVARTLAVGDELLDRVVWYLRLEQDPLAMAPLGLRSLVAQARADADAVAAERAQLAGQEDLGRPVTVDVVLPAGADDDLAVVGDRDLLVWCLAELMTNARAFGAGPDDDPTAITVTAAADEDGWVGIEVANTGRAIDPMLAPEAFVLGRMLQPRGQRPGVGMGLPLCRRIVARHGGHIAFTEARSAEGPATALVLRLLGAGREALG